MRGVADHLKESEPQRIYSWRQGWALELGFSRRQARLLNESGADRVRVESMVNAGCSLDLIVQILT